MRKWRIEDSEELYNINGWGINYFGINKSGHVYVTPRKDGVQVDLKELVDELSLRDISAPVLVRFPDILDNRIEKTYNCFEKAAKEKGLTDIPLKVAIMGCAVNGPGEAREADIGVAGGIGEALLFRKGEIIKKIDENLIVDTLIEEIEKQK